MSGARVLVVDDNLDSARLLSLLLETMGFDARTATTGEEALAICHDYRPDAVVLDLTLPDTTGFELAGRMRAIAGLESVKLVAVTGWSDSDAGREAKALGFRAFLVKPVDPEKLIAALQ